MPKFTTRLLSAVTLLLFIQIAALAEERRFPTLGRVVSDAEVRGWDIAIGPNGEELPIGAGSVDQGAAVYAVQCAYCHGAKGNEGPDHKLVGGTGTLDTTKPVQTIGSYWPFATTVFDYINRAMPFLTPGSLSVDEVYAVTAFLLYQNGIIDRQFVISNENLAAIEMPNRNGFIADPRPEKLTEGGSP